MPVLATNCPVCGSRHEIVAVVPVKLGNYFKLWGVDEDGDGCCSYDDHAYDTQAEAEAAAKEWDADMLAELNRECAMEALACEDEHGYFFDYGPVDSDYYD